MDYNQTVHLPQTDFPMRAGLPKREPEMLQEMYDHDLYHKMVKRNEGKPTFVLHDGPPYANGNIHIGTALNKILKDMIVKHRNMTGWCAPYVPGWDTHGLPIESAVLKDKKVKRDEMTTAQFRTKCREYAESYIEKMTGQFQRLGVLGEWESPLLRRNGPGGGNLQGPPHGPADRYCGRNAAGSWRHCCLRLDAGLDLRPSGRAAHNTDQQGRVEGLGDFLLPARFA